MFGDWMGISATELKKATAEFLPVLEKSERA